MEMLPIPTRSLPGTEREVSIVTLGTSSFGRLERAMPVYDQYAQRGGSFFDTAWVYGLNYAPGCCESVLGTWIKRRGISEQVTVLVKGGHSPYCTPAALGRQLSESLYRLQRDHADIYMLHRDDPTIPVGEFVDAIQDLVNDGLVRAYGFSNWTLDRVSQAIAYTRSRDYPTPAAISNQLSLAVMHQPVYPGCVHVSDAASRTWLEQTRMALVPWSSQARGVFTDVDSEAELQIGKLAASWYSPGNWQRVERARKIAADRGVLPVNIALAWVLHQPFPTFPIIGPRTVDELNSSLDALSVRLTGKEFAWLTLDHDTED